MPRDNSVPDTIRGARTACRAVSSIAAIVSELTASTFALYFLPLAVIVLIYMMRRRRAESRYRQALVEAVEAGLTEPVSLHPVVDPAICVGSAGCVEACPEQALGIIGGKAQLISPAACIGHGACADACPVSAITLVFGSERRGVDIPMVKPDFETNIPGIFIAGELGGMGLIRKASEQGRQAIQSIARRPRSSAPLDVVIVGAGPAGLAAALGATELELRYLVIDQEPDLGGAILHFPRNKIAMTSPVDLPVVGRVEFSEVSKEALLAFWQDVVARTGLKISFGTRMDGISRVDGCFRIETNQEPLHAGAVLLAIGRRGTPRKLEVPGEELPKVVYRLIEAGQYRGQRVLVVGGGDSAIEAALACAAEPGTAVTLAYRGEAFSRLKAKNRELIQAAGAGGRVDVRLKAEVRRIQSDAIELLVDGAPVTLGNDAVIVQAGGVLPTALLRDLGVTVQTMYGTA